MSKKILLIEDNDLIRANTSEILALANYEVVTSKNGKEGVEAANKEKPDLIICDIMMPIMDGYGVLHSLSKKEETASIPFIFLTAKAERSDFRKGMDMGADDYITKPFDDIELLNAIESRLKKAELMKKDFSKNVDGLNDFMSAAKEIEDLKKLSEKRETQNFKKKETVYMEDTYSRGVYFVVKGKVKTYKIHEQGKELITEIYKDGDFFGYLALLEKEKHTDSAAALEDTELCFIPKEDFLSLIYRNAGVSRKFIKILSDNIMEKEEKLVNLAYNSVRKKVADILANLANKNKKEGQALTIINISREDLANLAGTATETTIRTLSDFKDEGLIDIKGGSITIVKPEKLATLRN
jgi:CRP-like cAMP-binding protein/CheY-like chemotaxis protein